MNSETELYGSYDYDPNKDIARFIVIPQKSHRYYETLTFDIDLIPNNARVYISWEYTTIDFELMTSTDQVLMNYIDEFLLPKKEGNGNLYSNAAEQLYFLNKRLNDAIQLTDIAIEKNSNVGFARRVKMDIYEKLHLYENAIGVINNAVKNETDDKEIEYWNEHKARISKKIKTTSNSPDK